MLELVLNVEQPYTGRSAEHGDRQMHQQERPYAAPPHHGAHDKRDCSIGRHGAEPRLPARRQAKRKPLAQNEQIRGADTEQNHRMAVQAVPEPPPARQRQIFAHGESVDVADAAAIKIT